MEAENNLHFAHYLGLLQRLCPGIHAMLAFDQAGQFIWQDGSSTLTPQQAEALLGKIRNGQSDDIPGNLEGDSGFEIIDLRNEQDELILTLCMTLNLAAIAESLPLADNENLVRLNQFLLVEYEQSLALARKDDELNLMTDELVQRYEELNLIYKAEDQALNIYHGRELLRQLVNNTSRYLNVDIIFLYLVDKNISLHKFENDNPLLATDKLFNYLRNSAYPLVESAKQAIVINHVKDIRKLGIDEDIPYKHIASPIMNAESEVIGLLAIASQNFSIDFSNSDRNLLDVMAKKVSKIAQSHFDSLTGLENSNSFELIIKDLLKQSHGQEVNHAIASVDIDRMAVINDVSGREAGDQLIRKVGQTIAGMLRSRDTVARIGSDKFGVLLENCDLPTAKIVMRKISDEVGKIDMQWEGKSHEVSISVGIAPIDGQSQSVTSILSAAETAGNLCKNLGRNTIHILEIDDNDLRQRKEQIRWVGRIQSALHEDNFILYAQLIEPMNPNIDQAHYEILLRMRDDDGSPVPPGKFLPAAEIFYLMSSIDHWVIDQTFKQLSEFTGTNRQAVFPVSINLSGQSLNDPVELAGFISEKLQQYRVDGSLICFEITESAAIANIDDARRFIEEIRKLGCKFSLDDFGTGLSSFAYLKNLDVDYLKIDGSFVVDIAEDKVSESMVSAINQIGHAMQLKTVAEFVENETIKNKLISIGVDFGQGYGLGKPMPLADIFSYQSRASSKTA